MERSVRDRDLAENRLFMALEARKTTIFARSLSRYGALSMAKPQHKIKKANHGRRPANAQAKRAKRRKVRT